MENKINHKKYVGQTNNFKKRMNGHKSDSNNPNSRSYNYPLSNAIRKYGWKNFDNYIVEEFYDEEEQKYIDERERFFIEYHQSLSGKKGYNICLGGSGNPKQPKTYEEKLRCSKIFSPEEIKDIQTRLKNNDTYHSILKDYSPRLTDTFLSNINLGLNFKNDDWVYPLKQEKDISVKFETKEIQQIKAEIKSGKQYKDIAKDWKISTGLISLINNGTCWYDPKEEYPLCIKSHSKIQNLKAWVKPVQEELMYGTNTIVDIAKKYNKAYSTIKKINSGSSHRNANYKYPLTSNRT